MESERESEKSNPYSSPTPTDEIFIAEETKEPDEPKIELGFIDIFATTMLIVFFVAAFILGMSLRRIQ